ncbi:ATP-binding protein [Vibrio galatheae]|uniref:ATP-binding protein n=1 Tax=Vibrio galatheae TaxID=579748 RepID=UPI0005FA4211|nr:ATP-binding protein [Vibrio galatheae]
MLIFDKRNGMHLFSLFIVVCSAVFFSVSLIFVQHQASKTAQVVIDESLDSKLTTVEQYVTEYIHAREQILKNLAQHPLVLSAVLEGIDNPSAFYDQLKRYKPIGVSSFINVYDFVGEKVYSDLALPEKVTAFIADGIQDGSLLVNPSYSIFDQMQSNYLIVTLPVEYNSLPEGLVTLVTPLDDSRFYSGFGSDSLHWFGLKQDRFNWSMHNPNGWLIEQKPVKDLDFTILYSYSPQLITNAKNNFIESLLVGMALATLIAIVALFIFGQHVLVSPFQALYKSEKKLRKQSKQLKRREAESARLARLVKYMRDAVIFVDANSHIVWVNAAFEQLTGYTEAEALGRDPDSLLHGELTSRLTIDEIREVTKLWQSGSFELINYHKNGQWYWIELTLTPLFQADGKLEGYMAVKRDISQRIELQDNLEQKAIEANAANIAKSKFLAAMSHELRTPMNGILGVGELLQDTSLDQEQKEYVDTLLNSGHHMMTVLNDILDFSKTEAGKVKLEQKSFLLADITTKLTNLYTPLCAEKGIYFVCQCDFDVHVRIASDETRLMQVLQNLLSNALKFTISGQVKLAVGIEFSQSQPTLKMSVSDSGIGISQEKQALIFDPFSQAETDTTRRFGGTGLGLAIVSELVNVMQGTIDLNSTLGTGSTFTVSVPISLATDESADQVADGQQTYNGTGMWVLIVEDTKVNAMVLGRFLDKLGFEYDIASNGLEAIEQVTQRDFDVVFMDNHMPVMDGTQAVKEILGLKLPHQPVMIGCTADAYQEARDQMISAGCCDVITKPISSTSLNEILFRNVTSKADSVDTKQAV